MTNSITFNGHELDTIQAEGGVWLLGNQIGSCMEYMFPDKSIQRLYRKNAHQFSPDMIVEIEVLTHAGIRKTRAFSPRGAALLALLAKTPVADRFRAFVLDKLEGKPIENLSFIQEQLLIARPDWRRLKRYIDMGLRGAELEKLMGLGKTAIRARKRAMEACGLLIPPQNLAFLQSQATRLFEGRISHG